MLLLVVQKGGTEGPSGMMVVVPGSCIRLMQHAVLGLLLQNERVAFFPSIA